MPTQALASLMRVAVRKMTLSPSVGCESCGRVYRRVFPAGLAVRWHGGGPGPDAKTVSVKFVNPVKPGHDKEDSVVVDARIGENLLQTAHRHDIELEGACEGVCACSTCHLIIEHDLYDKLDEPSEDEEDMLDMAFGLTETSRLGCQIAVTEDMEGAVLTLPQATRNFYVDGHVPKPH